MRGRRLFWVAFILACAMLAWRDIHDCHALPWPPRFIGAGIAFGMLDILAAFQEELAGVIAVGFVIGIAMNKGFKAECNHAGGTAQPASYLTPQQQAQPPGNIPGMLA